VVVVEDNADTREMLCEVLSLAGFECTSADNGKAGLSLIERLRPDVAIVDLGLPEIDGFEVARRVRRGADDEGPYLVALTGYGQPNDRAAALDAGFDEHMVKPADPERLIRLLSGVGEGVGAHADDALPAP
jgi:two-component system, chemotaxis family, CheB/CheR fusion protein